jgi:hypothetical protein
MTQGKATTVWQAGASLPHGDGDWTFGTFDNRDAANACLQWHKKYDGLPRNAHFFVESFDVSTTFTPIQED